MIHDKYKRVIDKKDEMRFQLTALLRIEEESADTYQLQMKRGQLVKNVDKGQLPYWVV